MAALLLAPALAVRAQEKPAADPPEVQMHRPGTLPDRITLTWVSDPATSLAVTWRTEPGGKGPVAQIVPAHPGISFEAKAKSVEASTQKLDTKRWQAAYHTAQFQGLEPDTAYLYRVGDGDHWSEWFQVRTAKDKPAPFSFLYFGDVQHGMRSLWSRVLRESFRTAPDARFMVFAGDLVTDGNDDLLWGDLFGAGGWLFAMTPVLPTPGNHEYRKDDDGETRLAKHWGAQFKLRPNGPEGVDHGAYYIDYQGVRMVSLNSYKQVEEQAAWLDDILSRNPNKWTVAFFHYPLYSLSKGREDHQSLIKGWKPVFDRRGVDLVLTGHDHTYARSGLQERTVYVTSVSGSKMYELDRKPWMKRAAENTQLYQVVSVDGDRLSFETRTATGSLYDAFELRKGPGGTVSFKDRAPKGVPERIRPAAD